MFTVVMRDGTEANVSKIRNGLYQFEDWDGKTMGFAAKEFGPTVENRDTQSDAFTCFKVSMSVSVNGVEFSAYDGTISGPNMMAVKEAVLELRIGHYGNDDM